MKYNLPKKHFSWSQYNSWTTRTAEYIDKYVKNKGQFVTKEIKFGKDFAFDVEKINKLSGEIEIKAEIDGVPQLAFLDKLEFGHITEFKTGKQPWTQERVNNHKQLDYYALCLSKQDVFKKEIAENGGVDVTLIWDETQEDERGDIRLTGKEEKLERKITIEEIEKMELEVKRVMQEISDYMDSRSLEVDEDLFKEYARIEDTIIDHKEAIKILEEYQKPLEDQILEVMNANKMIKKDFDFGVFSQRKNTKYQYTEETQKIEQLLKEKKDIEKKSGFAIPEITYSVSYKKT